MEENEIELDEINIILKIPKDSARIDITAHIINEDGNLSKVKRSLNPGDIHECRQDFLDNVEFGDDYDGAYVITDKGREYLEQLSAEGRLQ